MTAPVTVRAYEKRDSCGKCSLCCKVVEVVEVGLDGVTFKKPSFEWCEHARPGTSKACSIYERRPIGCQFYVCAWRAGLWPENARPDRSRVVPSFEFRATPEGSKMILALYQNHERDLTVRRADRALLEAALRPMGLAAPNLDRYLEINGVLVTPGTRLPRTLFWRAKPLPGQGLRWSRSVLPPYETLRDEKVVDMRNVAASGPAGWLESMGELALIDDPSFSPANRFTGAPRAR